MDIVTLGAALNGSAEYVNSHFKGGSNIQIVNNPDGTQTINASGEVSAEDTVARADIAAIKDGETLDSFGDVETALNAKQNTISDLAAIRSGAALGATAVQPETGKGLSTNDYTTAEKTKLAGVAEGAEVNVQSNWTQTTTTADDYIKNKPTLGTAAAKNATDTYNATGTDVTTGKAVAEALATLPEPMIFKGSLGTGGTITTLPTASSSNKGYVYKVITAGTYASQSAKIGDTFISDGSAWVLIPSGDEPSGTVTNVAVANGGGLTVSGSPITSSGTITVGHSNSVTAKTSSSLKKFTYDAYGHVTGSSELSTAESDALASGIDSTKVEQIETNKNNISTDEAALVELVDSGAKNQLSITATSSGIYTVNADGTVVANSDSALASNSQKVLYEGAPPTSVDNKFVFSGCPSGGSTTTYRLFLQDISSGAAVTMVALTGEDSYKNYLADFTGITVIRISIVIYSGYKPVNVKFYPMLCTKAAWDISQTYQPYRKDLAELTVDTDEDRAELVEIVDSGAKNICNFVGYSTNSMSGVSRTDNPDGTFTYNGTTGTTAGTMWIDMAFDKAIPLAVYGTLPDNRATLRIRLLDNQDVTVDTGNGALFTPTIGTTYRVLIRLSANTTFTNYTVKPMICTKAAWDISHVYQPYRPSYQELYDEVQAKITKSEVYNRGTAISTGDDLNDYTSFGKFYASTGTIAESLANCPITTGFVMAVEATFQSGKMQTLVTIESGGNATVTYRRSQVYRSSVWSWLPWYKFEGTVVS